LKVVASVKVTPSVELADVCNTSPWKMSSLRLSGVAAFLRVTVALPVRVATLPIGSIAGAWSCAGGWAGVCAGTGVAAGAGGAGVGAGWICANSIEPEVASGVSGQSLASTGEGIAKTFVVPARRKQQRSQSVNEGRYRVTIKSGASNGTEDSRFD
jgi:hypothetical protein